MDISPDRRRWNKAQAVCLNAVSRALLTPTVCRSRLSSSCALQRRAGIRVTVHVPSIGLGVTLRSVTSITIGQLWVLDETRFQQFRPTTERSSFAVLRGRAVTAGGEGEGTRDERCHGAVCSLVSLHRQC